MAVDTTADRVTISADSELLTADGYFVAPVAQVASAGVTPHGAADYAQALGALLPTGIAWSRDRQATLTYLVAGLAGVWGRIDGRARDLLDMETDPRTTSELLPDWERAFGLPEACGTGGEPPAPIRFAVGRSQVGRDALVRVNRRIVRGRRQVVAPPSVSERRAALLAKITTGGGQSRAFFINAAAALGYRITITEFSPWMVGVGRVGDTRAVRGKLIWFRCGQSRCGVDPHLTLPADFAIVGDYAHRIGPPTSRFTWRVNVSGFRATRFHVGSSRLGVDRLLKVSPKPERVNVGINRLGVDPLLRVGRANDLECLFRRSKPAATETVFDYGQVQ